MSFKIGGLQKSTFIDFPNKLACIIFTQGCNFRCGYCHNPELFENKEPTVELSALYDFLKSRIGKLDGVVITGGEPTLQKDLKEIIKQIKSMGFLVKLDTNGSNPDIIRELIEANLVDYIAMDVKAPLNKYNLITNTNIDTNKIKTSIDLLINSDIDYEFRTTVLKNQLTVNDLINIGELIKGAKKYYLQEFVPSKILDETLANEKSYNDEEFKQICVILEEYVNSVEFR